MGALTGTGVRILLIGTGQHTAGSELPDLPTVSTTVTDLAGAFVERCGAQLEQVKVLLDPESPLVLGRELTAAAAETEDVLLVCYLGHGLLDARGELYLATQATDHLRDGLSYTALPYATLCVELASSRARSVIVLLDCCFSGRAIGSPYPADLDGFATTRSPGGYLLASAAPEEVALAPTGERYTAFTGELIRLLREGDPTGPPELALDHLYRCLDRVLPEQGRPRPRRYAAGRTGELVLASNLAYQPPVRGKPRLSGQDPAGADAVCPYRGLATFDVADARYFFGREALTKQLLARLAEQLPDVGMLVVVGPSGSGKSSLLRAGLIPALDTGLPDTPGSWAWPRVVFTPGAHPIATLADRLARPAGEHPDTLHARLGADPAELSAVANAVLSRHARGEDVTGRRLVLVIDQFEELFTTCEDPQERRAFLDALSAAAASASLVVLGLRADFYAQCATEPQLVEALQRSQFIVTPMNGQELAAAIEGPAAQAGLAVEPGLVTLMLRDLRTNDSEHTSGLPLLSHALLATWQQREGDLLTLAGYEATGGIWQAATCTAEDLYAGLTDTEKDAAQLVLLRMVHLGESGTEDTRRRVRLADLPDTEDTARVLTTFADARLITLNVDTAEISHEALLRAWPRLADWIETDREGLRTHQQLSEDAEAWEHADRDPSGLYRGTRLAIARAWAASGSHKSDLNPAASAFLAASTEQERRAARRGRALRVGLAVLVILTFAGAIVAFIQRSDAKDQQRLAIARQLVAQADAARDTNPRTALLLGIAAQRIHPNGETQASLVNTLTTTRYTGTLTGYNDQVTSVAFSPTDGHVLAALSTDGSVILWDLANPAQPHRLSQPVPAGPSGATSIAFSTDGTVLATGSSDGSVLLWGVNDPAQPFSLGRSVPADKKDSANLHLLAFSPDGHTLATNVGDTVTLWNLTNPVHPVGQPLTGWGGPVISVVFSPNGHTLVTGGRDGTVIVWDITDPGAPHNLGKPQASGNGSAAFSPNGTTLATGSNDGTATLWDLTNPAQPRPFVRLPPSSNGSVNSVNSVDLVNSVAFSPDGTTLASSSADGTVTLWDLTNPAEFHRLPQPLTSQGGAAVFSAEGNTLATTSFDGSATLWDLTSPTQPTPLAQPLPSQGRMGITVSTVFNGENGHTTSTTNFPRASRVSTFDPSTGATDSFDYSFGPIQDDGVLPPILWDVTDPTRPRHLGPHLTSPGSSVAFSPNGHTLATGVFSPNGHMLATSSGVNNTTLWDVADPAQPHPLEQIQLDGRYPIGAGAFSPNGTTLATTDLAGPILWDVSQAAQPRRLGPSRTSLYDITKDTVVFSPNGAILATNSGSHRENRPNYNSQTTQSPHGSIIESNQGGDTVVLWDVTNPASPRRLAQPLNSQGGGVTSMAFSPNGAILATGSDGGAVVLWDLTNPAQPHPLAQPLNSQSGAASVAFSPNGTTLATGSSDGTVILWDLTNPAQPRRLAQPLNSQGGAVDSVTSVAFSPNGTTLATSNSDGTMILWDLTALNNVRNHATEHACSITRDGLAPDEWAHYIPGLPYQNTCAT
jgi:WD40 repeat protein